MTESEEKAYLEGRKSFARQIFRDAVEEIGDDNREKSNLILERAEAIATLRSMCAEYGDNDWDDNLHLADILKKHLHSHLQNYFD